MAIAKALEDWKALLRISPRRSRKSIRDGTTACINMFNKY